MHLTFAAERRGDGGAISDHEVERMFALCGFFTLVGHLWWAVWALLQAVHSNIDFDYMG